MDKTAPLPGRRSRLALASDYRAEGNDPTLGFHARIDMYEDLVTAGVIDPPKVVCTLVGDAASVAGLPITAEAMIAELPQDDKALAGMPGGGLGGRSALPC